VVGHYWLGNDQIHQLTKHDDYKLRVEVLATDFDWLQDYSYWAEYSTFIVGDEASNYQLTIGGYSGDSGDILGSKNGTQFSTYDSANRW